MKTNWNHRSGGNAVKVRILSLIIPMPALERFSVGLLGFLIG